jgi:hypothetical protein
MSQEVIKRINPGIDTVISKDEYYELVYQLQKERKKNEVIFNKNPIIDWFNSVNNRFFMIFRINIDNLTFFLNKYEE